MLIWLPIALLTGVAVLAVLFPLGSRSKARDEGGDVAFYRARLTEIEGDAARGLIEPQDAEAAKIEAARFLLAAERSGAASSPDSTGTETSWPRGWACP